MPMAPPTGGVGLCKPVAARSARGERAEAVTMPGARFCRQAALFPREGLMPTRMRCLLLTITAVAAAAPMAAAQPTPAPSRVAQAPLTQIIAVDPQVRVGRPPNGLQYFVRANAQPRGR